MNTSLMLVTHPGVGRMLLETAESILKRTVDDVECFEVPLESDPEERITAAKALRKKLDHGQGVLLLNDLYGATPFNVARAIEEPQHVLTGLNLCMLLRAINYQQHALDELANIAREGGQKGLCFAEQPEGKPRD